MMKTNQNKRLLKNIKAASSHYFDRGNKRFFNDISYSAYYSAKGDRYFLQLTAKWANVEDRFYRLHEVHDDYKIGQLIKEFNTLAEVKAWLKAN